jgi:hypothetical protein
MPNPLSPPPDNRGFSLKEAPLAVDLVGQEQLLADGPRVPVVRVSPTRPLPCLTLLMRLLRRRSNVPSPSRIFG